MINSKLFQLGLLISIVAAIGSRLIRQVPNQVRFLMMIMQFLEIYYSETFEVFANII